MGGCVASKLGGGEEQQVVGICRERKKMMKLAVDRRYALADAHCRYSHSLLAVSAAINLFVARHSTPSSPFLITFPPSDCQHPEAEPAPVQDNVHTNKQPPPPPTTTTPPSPPPTTTPPAAATDDSGCEYLYIGGGGAPLHCPCPSSPQGDSGWDFFNPFYGVRQNLHEEFRAVREEEGIPFHEEFGAAREEEGISFHEEFRAAREEEGIPFHEEFRAAREEEGIPFHEEFRAAREEEGIPLHEEFRAAREEEGMPNLEEEEEEEKEREEEEEEEEEEEDQQEEEELCDAVVATQADAQAAAAAKCGADEKSGLGMGMAGGGRELFHGLKDIEDHFIRAYDSAKHVSRMLEANKPHLTSSLDDIKENSSKLIQAITWQRSSSSCKSLVSSASFNHNSSSWIEYKNDLFDENAGMAAGSHSLTLGRLYAWEKKLYDEVKAGDTLRKLYDKKCSQLGNKNVKGVDTLSLDRTRAGAKDLYSRILVAIRRAESISENIQKLTAQELEPQINELLHGLAQSWRIMLESHQTQTMIIYDVKLYECPAYGKFSSESHRLATLQLEAEIQNWKDRFHDYVAAQRLYVEALRGWLSKLIVPEVEFRCKGRSSVPRTSGPPLYIVCHDWLSSMDSLPCKMVSVAMTRFVKDIRALWIQQGEEQEQRRKVDKLAKELDKKILAYQKAESRIHEPKLLLEYKMDPDFHKEEDVQSHQQVDELMEKKETLDSCKRRLDMEKERHNKCMQETQRITLNGFQTGFGSIFESLVQFAGTSLKMYNVLVAAGQSVDKKEDRDPSSLQESGGNDGS